MDKFWTFTKSSGKAMSNIGHWVKGHGMGSVSTGLEFYSNNYKNFDFNQI